MLARIYRPARSVMQSGPAYSRGWRLEFVPAQAKFLDPLMGWTGSDDTNAQVTLDFDSREAAVAYAEAHHIPYKVLEPKPRQHILRKNGYGDNFSPSRRIPWSH